jgi:hypothetical protein
VKPLRLSVFFFSVILVLAVSQVVLAQPPAPILIYPLHDETVGSTVPFLAWEGENADSVESYQVEIFTPGTTEPIYESLKLINKIDGDEKPDVTYKVPSDVLRIFKTYLWRVGAGKDETSAVIWSKKWRFNTNLWVCDDTNDVDCDGIPNGEEDILNTDPRMKTLFVRPKIKNVSTKKFEYCDKFIKLFPSSRPGFADIPPLTHAGIEIVVIGPCPSGEPCHKYSHFDEFNYDPAEDLKPPHCDIMEIIFKGEKNSAGYGIYCAQSASGSHGHTYFFKAVSEVETTGEKKDAWTWSWDTKGVTSKSSKHHGYFKPEIFSFPLENYFKEGAYPIIAEGESPIAYGPVSGQTTKNCKPPANELPANCAYSSPMNLNNDEETNPPYSERPDNAVEFIVISYEDDDGKIEKIGEIGTSYDRDTVLKRTIVHEMGHALFTADNLDHCKNPQCIMYENTTNWDMLDFGPVCKGNNKTFECEHSIGGNQDIRGKNIIHNKNTH